MDSLTISNLYYYYPDPNDVEVEYFYLINNVAYSAGSLQRMDLSLDTIRDEGFQHPSFTIDLNGSEILMFDTATINIAYQRLATGQFVELTNRTSEPMTNALFIDVSVLEVPLPGGHEINGIFQNLPLSLIDQDIRSRISDFYTGQTLNENSYDDILELINEPSIPGLELGEENDLRRLQQIEEYLRGRIARSREGSSLIDLLSENLDRVINHITRILNPPQEESFNVYIYNANPRTNSIDIINLFNEFGPMQTFRSIDNYYLASFIDEESANDALSLNGQTLDGNALRVTREPINETIIEEQPPDNLTKESHATYMSQVYGLPVILPEFLMD